MRLPAGEVGHWGQVQCPTGQDTGMGHGCPVGHGVRYSVPKGGDTCT